MTNEFICFIWQFSIKRWHDTTCSYI